jgi:hypothetical protein
MMKKVIGTPIKNPNMACYFEADLWLLRNFLNEAHAIS